jgi:acyl dehydratase
MSDPVERLPSWQRHVSDADARAWADVLQDHNPLHADAAATGASGLGEGLVNPGPAAIGYLMTMLLEAFPGAGIRSLRSKFLAPVLTPTDVVATGVVERREHVDDGDLVHASLELHARGTQVLTARAIVHVARAKP